MRMSSRKPKVPRNDMYMKVGNLQKANIRDPFMLLDPRLRGDDDFYFHGQKIR